MEKSPEEKLKQEKMQKTARTIWMFLTPLFAILALYNLYTWQIEGKDNLSGFLSPPGMMCVGLGIVTAQRSKSLSNVFLTLDVIAVFVGLALAIRSLFY